jgi:hypothetical protein
MTTALATALPPVSALRTLDDVRSASPALGVRRLLRITQQLAIELEQARQLGLATKGFTASSVLLVYPGTPFERVRIACWSAPSPATDCTRAQLKQIGVWLCRMLAEGRLYLDHSASLAELRPVRRPLGSRADLEVLQALRRGLTAIAKRCKGEFGAVPYATAGALAHDLARLTALTGRIAARLRQAHSSLLPHFPKPAALAPGQPLPKVMLNLGG